jgi:CubicO group peptidase (beta-lactamase class C family)
VTSIVAGAAARSGVPLAPDAPVYALLRPGREEADPRRRDIRLEHLLTMSSGLDCDENREPAYAGIDATYPTAAAWRESILDIPMARAPGAEFLYCDAGVQMAGWVTSRVAGRPFIDLMRDLVAEPLGIRRYYAGLTPERDAVLGGGWYFRPRDFMKLGQLYLNGGTWQGRRVVDQAWVDRSVVERYRPGRRLRYGYLWWMIDYPLGSDSVRAYFASGLGGQGVMVFPELDLVVAIFGGNYRDDEANWAMVVDLIPRYLLAAVRDAQ